MKTSVIMTRRMGQFEVLQRTKDGMFNATALLNQWNRAAGMKKEMNDYLRLQSTHDFLSALQSEFDFKDGNSPYLTSRGKYSGGTWMTPLLFIDFAMWLNPKFKVQVLKFVYDELIKCRTAAGDNYNVLAKSIASLPDVDYPKVARALNWIVFNKHERDIRNTATPQQLQDMDELQRKLAFSVDMGYIRSFPDLMNSMRRIYNRQHAKF
ncbi:KilA-N domain-containing protein [Alistipes finegoldii]|jgi:hypothetical protein|uniref:KilA-N domain-containing protein n=1 Tax=Alistipes finegoldii TaxID=214856 RepID=UPI001D081896|nr:KilA-N domain-containing protein [Alistipes finegoldii]MCB6684175.1 KilA-N domain-containing protein [Alistipes finegoldii]DAZ22733.1 MAG TPA: KilA protein [Caudoviricetes sp.]